MGVGWLRMWVCVVEVRVGWVLVWVWRFLWVRLIWEWLSVIVDVRVVGWVFACVWGYEGWFGFGCGWVSLWGWRWLSVWVGGFVNFSTYDHPEGCLNINTRKLWFWFGCWTHLNILTAPPIHTSLSSTSPRAHVRHTHPYTHIEMCAF
jgi:hypothetical protein